MYQYILYGMTVLSDIDFPQLVPDSGKQEKTITIIEGNVPKEKIIAADRKWEFGEEISWLENSTCYLFIENGNKIIYEIKPNADSMKLRTYILGWGMSMLALQRGILAIHCSVVAKEDGAVLIAGESGVGKSTLTNAFLQSGYRLMADDMALVETKTEAKQTEVYPAFPYQKLCRNVVEEKGYDLSKLIYINEQKDKFLVPYEGRFDIRAARIKGFIMLGIEDCGTVTCNEIRGIERFQIIVNNLFLRHLLGPDKYKPEIGALAMKMAANVPVAYIGRPVKGDTTEDVIREALDVVGKW